MDDEGAFRSTASPGPLLRAAGDRASLSRVIETSVALGERSRFASARHGIGLHHSLLQDQVVRNGVPHYNFNALDPPRMHALPASDDSLLVMLDQPALYERTWCGERDGITLHSAESHLEKPVFEGLIAYVPPEQIARIAELVLRARACLRV